MATAVRIDSEFRKILIPAHPGLVEIFGDNALHLNYAGQDLIAVDHCEEVTTFLRNLTFDVPSPMAHYYNWNGRQPFASQVDTSAQLASSKRFYVLNDIGTGKTYATLAAIDWLIQQGVIARVLVVAPLSTLNPVWEKEIFTGFPKYSRVVVHGPRAKRIKLLSQQATFTIINHHGVGVLRDELLAEQFDLVVIDELAVYRNARTAIWKHMRDIAWKATYVWGLTGAPTPNAPTDAYAQAKLITPKRVPKYFTPFKDATMHQVSQFKWIPKATANDIVFDAMQPAVRYRREDCFDLPPLTYSMREVPLEKGQAKAYKQILDHARAMVDNHQITAVNAGVELSKLLQISLGVVYDSDGATVDFKADGRVRVVLDLIEEAEGKVIIFVNYLHALGVITKAVQDAGYNCETISGEVSKRQRDIIFGKMQAGALDVIVAHPKTMAHGLTLTAANTIIWFGPTTSYETFLQANGRINRPGQVRNTHIIMLESTPAERRVYNKLENKGRMLDALLELFELDVS